SSSDPKLASAGLVLSAGPEVGSEREGSATTDDAVTAVVGDDRDLGALALQLHGGGRRSLLQGFEVDDGAVGGAEQGGPVDAVAVPVPDDEYVVGSADAGFEQFGPVDRHPDDAGATGRVRCEGD